MVAKMPLKSKNQRFGKYSRSDESEEKEIKSNRYESQRSSDSEVDDESNQEQDESSDEEELVPMADNDSDKYEHDSEDDDNNNEPDMKSLFAKVSALEDQDTRQTDVDEKRARDQLRKAQTLKSQVALHHKLIEMRIHLQQLLQAASEFKHDEPENQAQILEECQTLHSKLQDTRNIMMQHMELDVDDDDDDDDADDDDQDQRIHETLQTKLWKPVLNKRYDNLELFAGKKNLTEKKFKSVVSQSFYDQVESVLSHERLMQTRKERHPLLRSHGDDQEDDDDDSPADEEHLSKKPKMLLYEDTKLYQAMLQDFLKQSTQADGLTLRLQRQRAAAKANVDRRASKGRKIRYNVHDKLTNFTFCVPRAVPAIDDDAWFSTLFKGGR